MLEEVINRFMFGYDIAIRAHDVVYRPENINDKDEAQNITERAYFFAYQKHRNKIETLGFLVGTIIEMAKHPYQTYKVLTRRDNA